jgi:peroxiredoxin
MKSKASKRLGDAHVSVFQRRILWLGEDFQQNSGKPKILFKSKMKIWTVILLRILLVVLVPFVLNIPTKGEGNDLFSRINIQPIKDKRKAPNFSLATLDGKKVELKNFKGKVVFLNFWATWCGPCKEEMPSMEALHQQFKEKDFVFLTISVDYAGLNPVKEFMEKQRYTFPVLIDQKCDTLDPFEVKGVPTTFIIDKKGRMIGKASGPRNWRSPEVISLLNQLISEKEK